MQVSTQRKYGKTALTPKPPIHDGRGLWPHISDDSNLVEPRLDIRENAREACGRERRPDPCQRGEGLVLFQLIMPKMCHVVPWQGGTRACNSGIALLMRLARNVPSPKQPTAWRALSQSLYDWIQRFNASRFATFERVPNPKGRPPIPQSSAAPDTG